MAFSSMGLKTQMEGAYTTASGSLFHILIVLGYGVGMDINIGVLLLVAK